MCLYAINSVKNKKKIRKHRGIHQLGGKKGKLKKGYRYSGKKLKSGLSEIINDPYLVVIKDTIY